MAKITIHAGDWPKGAGQFLYGQFAMPKDSVWGGFDAVGGAELASVDIATEESVKRIGGTIGWGAVGGLLLGPVGLLAGLLGGGRGTDVTFVAKFKDGRKFLGSTDSKTYRNIAALVF